MRDSDYLDASIAVVDLETTGLFTSRYDRVLELAVVRLRPDGTFFDEYVTLINPGRDIGATAIHGISASDVVNAPTFEDVAGDLVNLLKNSITIAAHNARFDIGFLAYEFGRLGFQLPDDLDPICTMRLASQLDPYSGRRLCDCCESFGIDGPDQAHTALSDARATSRLLAACIEKMGDVVQQKRQLEWPSIPAKQTQWVSRSTAREITDSKPTFLDRAVDRLSSYTIKNSANALEYIDLLDRCLEDRRLTDAESEALLDTATLWGLSVSNVRAIHKNYIRQLAIAALSDEVITDSERSDLETVAKMLGEPSESVENAIAEAKQAVDRELPKTSVRRNEFVGKSVCFTGELVGRVSGDELTREKAHLLAAAAGLKIANSVTKKLDLLVVADPDSQSSKARKARQYGTRIIAEPVFWNSIGVAID